MMILPKYLKF